MRNMKFVSNLNDYSHQPFVLLIGDSIVAWITPFFTLEYVGIKTYENSISGILKRLTVIYLEARCNTFYGGLKTFLFLYHLDLLQYIVDQTV